LYFGFKVLGVFSLILGRFFFFFFFCLFVVWALWEYLLDFGFLGALGIVCA
jgi:hypothetical protein